MCLPVGPGGIPVTGPKWYSTGETPFLTSAPLYSRQGGGSAYNPLTNEIHIMGGAGSVSGTKTWWAFDVATGAWVDHGNGPFAFTRLGDAAYHDGAIYYIPGTVSGGAYVWQLKDGSWTKLQSVPLGVSSAAAGTGIVSHGGLLYVNAYDYTLEVQKSRFYQYNPVSGFTFLAYAPSGVDLRYMKMIGKGNYIYGFGDYISPDGAGVYRYDIVAGSWETYDSLGFDFLDNGYAALVGETLIVGDGTTTYVYDETAKTLTKTVDKPHGDGYGSAAVSFDGVLYDIARTTFECFVFDTGTIPQ